MPNCKPSQESITCTMYNHSHHKKFSKKQCWYRCWWCPVASVVHSSGSGQLQANPHVAFPGKPTRRAVATMGSNDLVVGEDHMLGPSCQRYNWQTGRCGSIAFGSSPRRENSDFKPPLSCGSIHLWKRLQEITLRKNQEWSP